MRTHRRLATISFSQHGHGVKAESGMVPVKQAARTQMLDEARTCSNQTTLCGETNKASGAANQHLTPAQTNPHILLRKTMQTQRSTNNSQFFYANHEFAAKKQRKHIGQQPTTQYSSNQTTNQLRKHSKTSGQPTTVFSLQYGQKMCAAIDSTYFIFIDRQ